MTKSTEEKPNDLERRLIRKLDLRLMLWAFFGYFANGLDRNNMPNAYTNGMKEDLELASERYNWAFTMFFIGYIVLQIPANAVITKVRPSIMLPGVVTLWGAVVCLMALITDYRGLYGLRFCLGFAEAAFYPGIVFLLGSWYTKEELGARTAFFVAGSQMSGAFSGLISGAIASSLDGAHGMRGWKWLFIIEGLIAVIIGAVGFFLIPDYPHNTRFIRGEERQLAIERLERQGRKTLPSGLNMATLRNLLVTPYVYLYLGMFICFQMGMGLLQYFPIILTGMGYESSFANYMMVPIWIWVGIVIIAQGWFSDHYGKRVWHIVGGGIWTLIWYVLVVAIKTPSALVGIHFAAAYMIPPIFGVSPIMMTWLNVSNWKELSYVPYRSPIILQEMYQCDAETRALAIAVVNALGNLVPNFVNVKAWTVSDVYNYYQLGKIVTIGMTAAMIILAIITHILQTKKIGLPKSQQRIASEEEDIKQEIEMA
ncbi:hypothetical protein EC973_001709 [Apophysomyces ossiformis]|uniref:Major facilitator superfamily (MFS) profile domain-containing protein n=1 Tax=Apophysomyces ossiformis TaxID=679940 RepID=A0A8H7BTC8_9FUNG|nr:hypothetical protein EC973_001709 [Apophysomyces ossiformis]